MADVIAIWRADVNALYIDFPFMADVNAMWRADVITLYMLFQVGRCCANWPWEVIMFLFQMADVIAMILLNGWCYCHTLSDMKPMTSVVDVVTTWLCLADVVANVWSCGRCYCHLADVIAMRVEDWQVFKASVADVIATRVWYYFNFSSVMLFRTSSHTCGRWYLPIFLLRDGLFTLMYIASLISLI